jgi:high-affinity K+ transport system ATPase subunit B
MPNARIGGMFDCSGGRFANGAGPALNADGVTVDGGMVLGAGFVAAGEVRLTGAHVKVQLVCNGGNFSNAGGTALLADGVTVEGTMHCGDGFVALGTVRLLARIVQQGV